MPSSVALPRSGPPPSRGRGWCQPPAGGTSGRGVPARAPRRRPPPRGWSFRSRPIPRGRAPSAATLAMNRWISASSGSRPKTMPARAPKVCGFPRCGISRPSLGSMCAHVHHRGRPRMRARTITTTTGRRRRARRRLIALALGVCALAVPTSAGASYGFVSDQGSVPDKDSTGSGQLVAPDHRVLDASLAPSEGSQAPAFLAATSSPVADGDEFDWADAALGAAITMAVAAFAGGALGVPQAPRRVTARFDQLRSAVRDGRGGAVLTSLSALILLHRRPDSFLASTRGGRARRTRPKSAAASGRGSSMSTTERRPRMRAISSEPRTPTTGQPRMFSEATEDLPRIRRHSRRVEYRGSAE